MKFILLPSCFIFILAVHFANQFPSFSDDYEYDSDEQKDEELNSEDVEEPIELWSKGGSIYVDKGSTIAIPCNMSNPSYVGYHWKKGNTLIFVQQVQVAESKYSVANNNSLIIPKFDKSDEDYYTCMLLTADKIERKATYHVQISENPKITIIKNNQNNNHIEIDKPQLKIDKLIVNSAEGYESQLICTANAEPQAKIYWIKDDHVIQNDDRINIIEVNGSLILQIQRTKVSDFGNYTCTAENQMGIEQETVTLTNKPSIVKFQEIENILDEKSVILVWLVESIAPIVRYELMYKLKIANKWNRLSPQVVNPKNGNNLYEVRVELSNLEFGVYEVKLKSENEYGWTEFSEVHYFTHPDDRENMISDQQEIVAGSASIIKLSTLLISIILLIV